MAALPFGLGWQSTFVQWLGLGRSHSYTGRTVLNLPMGAVVRSQLPPESTSIQQNPIQGLSSAETGPNSKCSRALPTDP